MEESRLKYLFNIYFNDEASEEEENEFFRLIVLDKSKSELEELAVEYWQKFRPKGRMFNDSSKERMLSAILGYRNLSKKSAVTSIRLRSVISIAASLAIFLVLGVAYYIRSHNFHMAETARVERIQPGHYGATLTLANGKNIQLTSADNGQVADEAGVKITKSRNGQIEYDANQNNADNKLNELSTGNGEIYEVKLSDGSLVWLNSSSRIAYSTRLINSGKRLVSLSGEAYFEVAKDKDHPFVVESGKQTVQVLGTHFNISAYPDESNIVTTLLEGSVKVNDIGGNTETLLVPNQQSIFDGISIKVNDVSAEDAIAWKEGYFRFDNESLEEALKKISRWYNVTVIYSNEDIKHRIVYGTMSRFKSIVDVVHVLELTKAAKFRIEDHKIIASKY